MATNPVVPFDPEVESVTEFLQRFKLQNLQSLQAAREDALKAALLCRALPVHIITDIQRRIKPVLLTDAPYSTIEHNLTALFDIKKSVIGSAVKFINRKQQPNESIETYAKTLNDLASQCEYGECCRDRLLRDIFVSGLHSAKLISVLLQECETKSFHECVDRAKLIEQLAHDAADMKPDSSFVQFKVEKHYSASEFNTTSKSREKVVPENYVCIRCGARAKHLAHKCFALKMECHKCRKEGHLAKVCKSSTIHAVYSKGEDSPLGGAVRRVEGTGQPTTSQEAPMMTSQGSAMTSRGLMTQDCRNGSSQCVSCCHNSPQPSNSSTQDIYRENDSFLL